MFLLDKSVISECIKKSPNPSVFEWIKSVSLECCMLSVLTIGEIRRGIELLGDSKKKNMLTGWLENEVLLNFGGRIIEIDAAVSDKWGYITAYHPLPVADGLIAATALVHNFKLVTRNTKDFSAILGLEILNPWGY